MELILGRYCELEDVKRFLDVQSSDHDDKLISLINDVSTDCKTFLKRELLQTTYTDEYYDGDGTGTLLLNQRPIVSVTSLVPYEDAAALTEDDDFKVYKKNGMIKLLNDGVFPKSHLEIKITYVAGYNGLANLPLDLRRSVIEAVAFKYNEQTKGRIGVTHLTVGEQTEDFIDSIYPKSVLHVWRRYRLKRRKTRSTI